MLKSQFDNMILLPNFVSAMGVELVCNRANNWFSSWIFEGFVLPAEAVERRK